MSADGNVAIRYLEPLPKPKGTIDEVYIAYARAMQVAQVLEQSIGTILVFCKALRLKDNRDFEQRIKKEVDALRSKTLGNLKNELKQAIELLGWPPLHLGAIETALQVRNELAHSFFSQNGRLLNDPQARIGLVLDLAVCEQLLASTASAFTKRIDQVVERNGLAIHEPRLRAREQTALLERLKRAGVLEAFVDIAKASTTGA